MKHYEIVFLVHPGQSPQVPAMIDRYRQMVERGGGQISRLEDWGRRHLAYPINKVHKAHYILMNVCCGHAIVQEMEQNFQYNDAVLRHLILSQSEAIKKPSPMMHSEKSVDYLRSPKNKSEVEQNQSVTIEEDK